MSTFTHKLDNIHRNKLKLKSEGDVECNSPLVWIYKENTAFKSLPRHSKFINPGLGFQQK